MIDLTTLTPEELIRRSLELKAYIEAENDRFKTHMKPVNEEREAIGNELLGRLNQQGLRNFATEFGTAYKSTLLTHKITNRDNFLKCCLENWQDFGGSLLMVNAQVDAIKEYMENHNGDPPPGIDVSWYTRLNIKKG